MRRFSHSISALTRHRSKLLWRFPLFEGFSASESWSQKENSAHERQCEGRKQDRQERRFQQLAEKERKRLATFITLVMDTPTEPAA
jgi:hypothetical protein